MGNDEANNFGIVLRTAATVLIIIAAVVGIAYCVSANRSSQQADEKKAEETKKQKDEEHAADLLQSKKAVTDFLQKAYPEWTLVSTSVDRNDELSIRLDAIEPFYAIITRKGEERVISIVLKRFYADDGGKSWQAFEPRALQLGEIELKRLRLKEFREGQINPEEY